MGLETGTFLDDLVATNPVGSADNISAGDDHLRLIKSLLLNSFPDVNQAVSTIIFSATEPALNRKGTVWGDETANLLKIRDKTDSSWITLAISMLTSNSVDINAGAIDGTPIGAASPSTGVFTTLSATNLSATNMNSTPIGQTTPAAGKFTNLEYTGTLTPAIPIPIPAGTVMLFFQAAAPTGWTEVTTQNDKAIRIVSGTGGGTGGTVPFETAFASQAVSGTNTGTAITIAQMPVHAHSYNIPPNTGGPPPANFMGAPVGTGTPSAGDATSKTTGSGNTHTHTFNGTAIDMDVQFINCKLADKD